jgi:anti-sigma B factor antagonist
MREVAESDADNVVLDLGQVMFMDSSGLGAVVAVMKMMGREKTFRIAGLSPAVDKVFKLTRMDSVFKILASADEALNETHQSTG